MKTIFRRLFWRVLWSSGMTVTAFALMQPLALATGVPEVARLLPALAVLYWLDLSLLVSRIINRPGFDLQSVADHAERNGGGASLHRDVTFEHLIKLVLLTCVIYLV